MRFTIGAAVQCNASLVRLALKCAVTLTLAAAVAIPPGARAQGGFRGPGRYEITSVESGKAVQLNRNDRTTVLQFSPRHRDDQFWDIRPAEPGFWSIRSAMTWAALEVMGMANNTPVRGTPFNGGPSQQWRIAPGRNGTALITNRMGKALQVPDGASLDGARVHTSEVNGGSNQRFLLHRILAGSNQ